MAEESVARLHGTIPDGYSSPIQVRFADTDAQRRLKSTTVPAAPIPTRPAISITPVLNPSYIFGSSPSDRYSPPGSMTEHGLVPGFAFNTRRDSPLSRMDFTDSSYTSNSGSPLPVAVVSGLVDRFKTSASAPEWWLGSSPVAFTAFSASAPGCFTVPEDHEITVAPPIEPIHLQHPLIPRTMRVQSISTLSEAVPKSTALTDGHTIPAGVNLEVSGITKRKSLPW